MLPDPTKIFANAFDTFKAFDNLTLESSGLHQQAFPTSIWQILNHLIGWQTYQLDKLSGMQVEKMLNEEATWIEEKVPQSEEALQVAVEQFKSQLEALKSIVAPLDSVTKVTTDAFNLIQSLALHLSFHLGEVVLIRRLEGTYPLPHQMNAFLSE